MLKDFIPTNKSNNEFRYIYNPGQADFYIKEFGCKVFGTGVNPKTSKVWYKFSFNDTIEAYVAWCAKV